MNDVRKPLAILSVPFLAAGYFLAFNVIMFGGLGLVFAFSSSCGSYGACINSANSFTLAILAAAFVAALAVLGAWTNWTRAILGWRLPGRR